MSDLVTHYRHAGEVSGSARAARRVVPVLLELVGRVRSVIDVGGGSGTWLREFLNRGVDSGYLFDRAEAGSSLVVDPACFRPCDMAREVPILPRADLVLCLECAEHLPAARAEQLVARLTAAADVVVFSAAVPWQGGIDHINEQPSDYWKGLFGRHGFTRLDVVRSRIIHDPEVPFWYRQNLFLFAKAADRLPARHEPFLPEEFHLVHRDILQRYLGPPGLRAILRHFLPQLFRAVAERLPFRGRREAGHRSPPENVGSPAGVAEKVASQSSR